jgi:hypothetical protein
LAFPFWIHVSVRFWSHELLNTPLLSLVGPPLLGLAFLRFGILGLLECALLVRLLRDGEVVFGTPDSLMLPGRARVVFVVAPFGDERVAVRMPAPLEPSARQAFLLDRVRRRIVAWTYCPSSRAWQRTAR